MRRHTTKLTTHGAILFATFALVFAGCSATTKPQRKEASIEVQEAVGFTITEEVKVPDSVRSRYDEAHRYLENGNFKQGVAILNEVAEDAPMVTAPRIDLGVAYHKLGKLGAAEENLLLAVELNPAHPVALNELGIVYRKTGRFADARRQYEAALAVYPGYHHARRNLAILCDLYLGDLDCALSQYEAYMATVPVDAEAEMWITDLRNRMAQ